MKKYLQILVILILSFFIINTSIFAEEEKENKKGKHIVSVTLNPFGPIFGIWDVEVGVPITGLFEVAGQFNYFNGKSFNKLIGLDDTDAYISRIHAGGVVRIFPAQTAAGFFISGRIMMFKIFGEDDGGEDFDFTDIAAGLDIGWRWKWSIKQWGILFQVYGGVERFITQDEIGDYYFPIIPVFGTQIGVFF